MSAEMTSPRIDERAERPRKVSFYLSADAVRLLGVAASMEDTDKSRVVERLIREGLNRWVVVDRARPEPAAVDFSGATRPVR
jgi:hypothetical protein